MMIGRRLNDRYKLLKMIGGGGMANVYLAHDDILDRDVAVKILRLDYANNEEFIKRFHREAQSVTTLSHPNIVNIYDVGEEEGIYYLVMEFVPGRTLKQYIVQQGMLSVTETLDVMEQLASAMSHAHHFEIVHRDIKPQNILIRDDGVVKVTDFGIATATSATTITHTNSVLGSVHYLSPEQARGGVANKKSDIYSLGIVMFELLTGRPPFSGESAVSIALKHLQNETPSVKRWNPDIPQSVENIILKATAKDPFYRYESVDEMKQDIVTALFPERANEERFHILEDEEATKALPIIRQEAFPESESDETIINTGKVDSKEEPMKDKEVGKKKKPKRRLMISLLVVFVLLTLGVVAAVAVVPNFFIPKDVKIPDVSGKTYADAVNILSQSKLQVASTPEIIYTDQIEEGKVIKTNPKAGTTVKENSKITIYQSGGKKKQKVKNYVGQSFDSVQDEVTQNFASVTPYYIDSDKPKGQIIEQAPAAGQEVIEEDQEFRVWISNGPKRIALADFTGWTESHVRSYISDSKLNVEVTQQNSDTVAKGNVISQTPKADTAVREGDLISVVISSGPKDATTNPSNPVSSTNPPKKVTVSDIQIPYQASADNKPQTVDIYMEDMNTTYDKPVQTKTITASSTISLDFTIAYGKTGRYKIVRDGVTITEKVVPYQ
ncbi:Stk1 family PASTA domain-containing Ser/Thr kinase [Ectobacillus sp. sgz5001026]|uniref:Stk1 family PASTA domain-containing Ser/Thr kinase n=1 Tax=Ectobacillus sp. sgz5001026 TaxID=3242473 RepID=UPI0036D2E212